LGVVAVCASPKHLSKATLTHLTKGQPEKDREREEKKKRKEEL